MKIWLFLLLAILLEVAASGILKASVGFKILSFGIVSLILDGLSFYLLSLVLVYIPLGVTYAIWSGLGIFFITIIGRYLFDDKISWSGYLGIIMIGVGAIIACVSTTISK